MAKKKFKPGGTSVGFKSIGAGLQRSRYELEQDTKRKVDAIALAKGQHRENTNINISGLADKAGFEENVQKEKDRLEGAVRARQQEALSIKAVRDVERIKGEAQEHEKRAKYWKDLTPKMADAASKLAQSMWNISEGMEAKAMGEAYRKSDISTINDFHQSEAYRKLYLNWLKDHDKIDNFENYKEFWRSFAGEDNHGYSERILDNAIKNRNQKEQEVGMLVAEISKNKKYKESAFWDKDTVISWYTDAAYLELKMHGISATSRGGKAIIQLYEKWGVQKRLSIINNKNAKDTESLMTQQVHAIKVTKDPILRRAKMKALAKTIELGTFKDGNNGFYTGVGNIADQHQMGMEHYVRVLGDDFNDEKEVRAFIEQFVQAGDEDKGADAKSFCSRHPFRCDEVVKKWTLFHGIKDAEEKGRIKAENTALKRGVDKQIQEHLDKRNPDSPNYDPNYKVSDEENNRLIVERALNANKGDEIARNYAFNKVKLLNKSYKYAGQWSKVQELINQGRHDDAALVFSTFNDTEREALLENFNSLQGLKHWTDGSGATGWAAVRNKATTIHKEGEISLDTTAEVSVDVMIERVSASYFGKVAQGMRHEEAMNEAFKEEKKLYDAGRNTKDDTEYPIGDNPYSRKIEYYHHNLLKRTRKWVYKKYTDTDDEEFLQKLADEQYQSKDNSLANAPEELRNLTITEARPDIIRIRMANNPNSYNEIIKDATFISPHRVKELKLVADNLANNVSFHEGDVSWTVPENVKALSKATNKTEIEIINDVLAHWGSDVRFGADGHVEAIIRNNGVYRPKPFSKYDETGVNYYEATASQGLDPMSKEIFTWKNMFIPETGRQFTTEDGDTIDLPDDGFPSVGPFRLDPKLEAFIQSNELEVDIDNNILSDSAKFLNEGGAQYLNWEQSMSLFGLQGLTNKQSTLSRQNIGRNLK